MKSLICSLIWDMPAWMHVLIAKYSHKVLIRYSNRKTNKLIKFEWVHYELW